MRNRSWRALPALAAFMAATLGPALAAPTGLTAPEIARFQAVFGDRTQRTPAEQKLESNLLAAVRANALAAAGLPEESLPSSVRSFLAGQVSPDGFTFVVIRTKAVPAVAAAVEALGARNLSAFEAFDTVTAEVPLQFVPAIAQREDVLQVGPREEMETSSRREDRQALRPKIGAVTSEAVAAHDTTKVHATGIQGAGSKVCVISDGTDSVPARITTGDLPASIQALAGQAGTGDEGTAMLEIVYDMAPGASLFFATGNPSVAQMATNIVNLRNVLGCHIIVDDITYFNEPAFQDGPISQAVNTVTAAGALFLSSAANSGNLTHGTSGTFEGDFIPSAAPVPAAITTAEGNVAVTLHNFGALPYATITGSKRVSLKWSDPLGASANDYDVFVMDPTGTSILASSASSQTGTQDPVEIASCNNCTFPDGSRVYVVKYSGANRAIRVDTHRGRISGGTAGSTFGHNAAASALSVAAVDVRLAAGGVFVGGAPNPVTVYSSDGPRKMFYTPTGVALTPGNVLFATGGGTTLPKVDLAAADCGSTNTLTPPGFNPFCGTSAAAPTVAAIAALVRAAKPSATAAQLKAALLASVLDIEAPGVDRDSGAGIVMSPGAVRAVLSPLVVAKSYSPSLVAVGGTSIFAVGITNPNEAALQGVAATFTYPTGLVNGPTPNPTLTGTGCAANGGGVAGGNTLTITAGTIPAGTTCTFSIVVTSATPGVYAESSGAVTTPLGLNTAAISATLVVGSVPGAPVIAGAAGGVGSASVSFLAPASNGGLPITSYRATCTSVTAPVSGVPASPVQATGTNGSPIVVTGLTNGFAYTCSVAATNAAGTGPQSAASAQFTPNLPQVSVTVTKSGTGSGTVTSNVGGLNCGATCTVNVIQNTAITLTAAAAGGSVFTGWTGACSGTAPCALTPSANVSTNANFAVASGGPTLVANNTAALAFGGQSVKTTAPAVLVSLVNTGSGTLTISSVAAAGVNATDFTITHTCASLTLGQSCPIAVVFTPQAAGARTGALNIATSLGPVSFGMTGTGELTLVTHYYRSILRRAPDAPGKAFWESEATRMQSSGVNINETWYSMAQAFYASPEYTAFGRDNNGFVGDLYNTFFNRAADGPGLAFWTGQIASGMPREVVLASFMFSTEFVTFTQGIFGNTAVRKEIDTVTDFYRGLLGRLPDGGGLTFWIGQFRAAQCAGLGATAAVNGQAESISSSFATGGEYAARARTNAQYVGDLYNAFLRRGGDLAGVQFWVNSLNGSTLTREQVRQNFVASAEFQGRVAAIIAQGCLP